MAYSYTPTNPDDEEQKRRDALAAQQQPAATTPDPATNADPFARNATAIPGNPETRYGAQVQTPAPTRATVPDAFDRPVPPQLLVPSPAITESGPATGAPVAPQQPVRVPGPPTLTATPDIGSALTQATQPAAVSPAVSPAPTPITPPPVPVSPFPGTLPGATPQPNAQPVQPRNILPDEEDAFRRRRAY